MNCLIFGGTGFIGSHLCNALLHEGHQVTLIARTDDKPIIEEFRKSKNFSILIGDYSDKTFLETAISNQDIIYYLISTTMPQASNDDPVNDLVSNVIPILTLLELAKNSGVKKIIYTSSGGTVYGKPQSIPISETHQNFPTSSYGIHKLTVEKYLQMYYELYGLDYSVLRISNPYGRYQQTKQGQGVIAAFINKAIRDDSIEIWGDGTIVRDYIHISDVIAASIRVLHYEGQYKVFNIGSGIGFSLNEIIQTMESVMGKSLNVIYTPGRKMDVPVNVLDISRAKEHLLWEPELELYEGLRLTIPYYQLS